MKRRRITAFAICPSCGWEGVPSTEDVGIGSYEYWGFRGFDSRIAFFCPECEEQIPEGEIVFEEEFDEPEDYGDGDSWFGEARKSTR